MMASSGSAARSGEGRIGTVRVEQFRHDDGEVVEREVVEHPGAAVMLPFDGERIWLVRQPREVVGEESLLELPAGKLNGGEPLETAKRELREEIGKSAAHVAAPDELLRQPRLHGREDPRVPGDGPDRRSARGRGGGAHRDRLGAARRLDDVIRSCRDSKSLVTLLWFRAFVL